MGICCASREGRGAESPDAPKREGPPGPPWINKEAQGMVTYKPGDVFVSVPPKSGTTWTMNIVHQLRSGGDRDMEEVYEQVRWLEFALPGQTTEELAKSFDTMPMPTEPFRAFKTHGAPPMFPFRPDCKYIVVLRNPCEAVASFFPFMNSHTDEFCAAYGAPPISFPDFTTFFEGFVKPAGFAAPAFFEFLKAWWPHRRCENVLMLHYKNMVEDHDGSITKIKDFLGIKLAEDQFDEVLELTSFGYMKRHGGKYEAKTIGPCPIMAGGAMIRKGSVGGEKEDGMSEAQRQEIIAMGKEILGDNEVLTWFLNGGEMPIDVEIAS